MKYLLTRRYRLRGWQDHHTALYDTVRKTARFLSKEQMILLMRCDGAHDIDEERLPADSRKFLEEAKKAGAVRPAGLLDLLLPEQEYKAYPARYIRQAHWSITGACNLKCRHCFMSAPHAKHGAPSHAQIMAIADQLAECGIFQVGLTGGEPLIRQDFLDIVDALKAREIGVSILYTNGWLVDDRFLDELDRRHVHPGFQLSFDGIGRHDFLRGVPGAEERTIRALKLLRDRKYIVSISMCMHRENRDVLRESVKLMASLGVRSMKCGSMMDLGEWAQPELQHLRLTREEELETFEEYIPQYFEDDAPLSIMLSGAFMYTPGESHWRIYNRRHCTPEEETVMPSCAVLMHNLYIGAEGMVCPCMGMGDCDYAKHFPNLFETPLKEILQTDTPFSRLCGATVGDVRSRNPKCRECPYVDRCIGGCRNAALMAGDDYYAVDPEVCWFFENKGEERITAAAGGAFEAYIRRNPPRNRQNPLPSDSPADCP